MHIREWQDGDDLRLLEIFGDPASAQHHHDRTMLGPSTQEPFGVGLVVALGSVLVRQDWSVVATALGQQPSRRCSAL